MWRHNVWVNIATEFKMSRKPEFWQLYILDGFIVKMYWIEWLWWFLLEVILHKKCLGTTCMGFCVWSQHYITAKHVNDTIMLVECSCRLTSHQSKCTAEGLVLTHYILFVLKLCVKTDASCNISSTYNLHWDLYQSNHTQTPRHSVGKYKDVWSVNMVTEKENKMLISHSGEK